MTVHRRAVRIMSITGSFEVYESEVALRGVNETRRVTLDEG